MKESIYWSYTKKRANINLFNDGSVVNWRRSSVLRPGALFLCVCVAGVVFVVVLACQRQLLTAAHTTDRKPHNLDTQRPSLVRNCTLTWKSEIGLEVYNERVPCSHKERESFKKNFIRPSHYTSYSWRRVVVDVAMANRFTKKPDTRHCRGSVLLSKQPVVF